MNAGIDLVQKSVRPIIERFAPSLSRSYRLARDLRWIAKPRRTSYGFGSRRPRSLSTRIMSKMNGGNSNGCWNSYPYASMSAPM